jgi:hypothetical protein
MCSKLEELGLLQSAHERVHDPKAKLLAYEAVCSCQAGTSGGVGHARVPAGNYDRTPGAQGLGVESTGNGCNQLDAGEFAHVKGLSKLLHEHMHQRLTARNK